MQVTGSGRYTHTATPGDEIKFLVLSTGVLNSSNPYTITVYDDRGLKIGQMVGHIVNSQTLTGQNYLNQTITGYYVDGYPIKGGVVGNYVRFFGQLKLQNGEPARMMQFIFDYTTAEDGIGSVYHEKIVRADHDGFFDILVPLPECKGYFTHIEEVSGLDPDLLFTFDRERYHVRADTINGEKVLSTENEYFFNLCQVRTIPDDDNPVMRILNPFTYE
ncbi:hypothetical protein [Saccharospirillum mangrovi]|uniref:hypothetical protein n=1 Tax=Saccharospirillum mangrovi TaxID=2161747 RepID=UPI001300686C|nr:hypothetical protein [Saccharospirillum mangrovi]